MFGVPSGPMVVALMGQQALPLFNEPVQAEQLEQLLDEINSSAVQAGMAGTVPPLVEATNDEGEVVLPPLHQEAEAALEAGNYAEVQQFRTNAAEHPDDVEAQLAVADLDLLGGHVKDAFDRLVKFISRSAGEDKDAARVHLLELYSVVGDDDDRVAASRRKLAA